MVLVLGVVLWRLWGSEGLLGVHWRETIDVVQDTRLRGQIRFPTADEACCLEQAGYQWSWSERWGVHRRASARVGVEDIGSPGWRGNLALPARRMGHVFVRASLWLLHYYSDPVPHFTWAACSGATVSH